MNRMKKLWLVMALSITLLIVGGCTDTNDSGPGSSSDAPTTEPSDEDTTTTLPDEDPDEDLPLPEFKETKSSFTLAFLPDTQIYTTNFRYYDIFYSQTQWIVDHQKQYNIRFTSHLGDLTHNNEKGQWTVADKAFKIMDDAKVPYGVTAGNHDINANRHEFYTLTDDERSTTEQFLQLFSKERAAKFKDNYGSHSANGWNSFYFFEGNGQKYMVMFLDYYASDATLRWANSILAQYPEIPTILVTHYLVRPTASGGSEFPNTPVRRLWSEVVNTNNQIFLTINGHYGGSGWSIKQNSFGNDVIAMVVDYQDETRGGNGWFRLLEFDTENNKIYAKSFSPYIMNMDEANRSSSDVVELTASNHRYTIDWDFSTRFDFN